MEKILIPTCSIGLALIGASSWYYGRKLLFITRIHQSISRQNSNDLQLGDYVCISGTTKSIKSIQAPNSKLPCIAYVAQETRILEKISQTTTTTSAGAGILSFVTRSLFSFIFSFSKVFATRKSSEELVSTHTTSAEWYISTDRFLGKKFCVKLDEFSDFRDSLLRFKVFDLFVFFQPTKVWENFREVKTQQLNKNVQTVGYKSTESIVKEGSHILVLGEVLLLNKDLVVLGSPTTERLIDLQTSRKRPLIVSTMTATGMKRILTENIVFLGGKLLLIIGFVTTTCACALYH